MFSHSNLLLSECALRAGAIYSVLKTHCFCCFFFLRAAIFEAPMVSCDRRSDETETVLTSHATTPWKCRIFSDLGNLTRDFLDDISSTDSEKQLFVIKFQHRKRQCIKSAQSLIFLFNASPPKCKSIETVNCATNKEELSGKTMFSAKHVWPTCVSRNCFAQWHDTHLH